MSKLPAILPAAATVLLLAAGGCATKEDVAALRADVASKEDVASLRASIEEATAAARTPPHLRHPSTSSSARTSRRCKPRSDRQKQPARRRDSDRGGRHQGPAARRVPEGQHAGAAAGVHPRPRRPLRPAADPAGRAIPRLRPRRPPRQHGLHDPGGGRAGAEAVRAPRGRRPCRAGGRLLLHPWPPGRGAAALPCRALARGEGDRRPAIALLPPVARSRHAGHRRRASHRSAPSCRRTSHRCRRKGLSSAEQAGAAEAPRCWAGGSCGAAVLAPGGDEAVPAGMASPACQGRSPPARPVPARHTATAPSRRALRPRGRPRATWGGPRRAGGRGCRRRCARSCRRAGTSPPPGRSGARSSGRPAGPPWAPAPAARGSRCRPGSPRPGRGPAARDAPPARDAGRPRSPRCRLRSGAGWPATWIIASIRPSRSAASAAASPSCSSAAGAMAVTPSSMVAVTSVPLPGAPTATRLPRRSANVAIPGRARMWTSSAWSGATACSSSA